MSRAEWKRAGRDAFAPLAAGLAAAGISANAMTVLGVVLSCGSAALFAAGLVRAAALALFAAGLCDVLDGAIARRAGVTSRFGAFFDSTLDRYSDGVVFAGIAWRAGLVDHDRIVLGLALAALIGAFVVSYARARAEGLGASCAVGWFERPERLLLLAGGALIGGAAGLAWPLGVVAVGAHITALQRIAHVHGRIGGRRAAAPELMEAEGRPDE